MKDIVRLANGQGFWGDSIDAPAQLVEGGGIDFLTLDYLAEVTLSIMQRQRLKNPEAGYARDFVELAARILPRCLDDGVRIVTNAGGVNAPACARALAKVAASSGREVRVGIIEGDDILADLDRLLEQGAGLANLETGEPVARIRERITSANVYIDSFTIAEALDKGAQIVLAGRVSDPGLALGPLIHSFGWGREDWNLLAAGTLAGHVTECGAQCTGGNHSRWWEIEDYATIGYPVVEARADGSFVVTWVGIVGGGTPVIYGQLFDAEGQPVGDNFDVAGQVSQGEGRSDPRPAMGPDGSFAVAWRVQVIAGEQSNDEVLIRRFDRFGSPAPGPPINPVDQTARLVDQINIHLAISPFGDMVAVWSDRRWGGWDIFRQRLSATGQPLEAANQQVNTDDDPWADQFNPAVATNGSSILTIWEDRPSTAGNIEAYLEVLETKTGEAGGRAKSVLRFRVNDDHPVPGLKNPRVAMDARGRFIVAWWDEREGIRYVWARRYDETGAPIGQAYSIIGGETRGIRQVVSVAVDTSMVQYTWSDARRDRGWDVYARRVDWQYGGESTPILLREWTAESQPEGVVVRWEVPYGLEQQPFRLWRDLAEGPPRLAPSSEAELVTPDWLLSPQGGRFEVLDDAAPAGETVWYFLETYGPTGTDFTGPLPARREAAAAVADGWRIAPVPFRERLELMPPRSGDASAEIFDLEGRSVRALTRRDGDAPLVWDGTDARGRAVPAGVYFVRLSGPADGPGGTVRRILRVR